MSLNNTQQDGHGEKTYEQLEDRLKECKDNGDTKGRALTLFDMAHIEIDRNNQEAALLLMVEAYSLAKGLEDLSCTCPIGELLGQLLYVSGSREEGLNMVRESYAGYKEIGSEDNAANTEYLLDAMEAHALANPIAETEEE